MYRTPSVPQRSDTIVICRSCGAPKEVALEQARFEMHECASCHVEQSVLRGEEELAPAAMTIVDHEPTTSYDELTGLAEALGEPHMKATQLTVDCDGIRILVSLSINSGSVVGVELVAQMTGLADARLTREGEAERKAAAAGVVREVQTGDAAFDAEVYIESPAGDDDVRAMLSSPGVRAAVRNILGETGQILVTPHHVKITFSRGESAFDPGLLRERLAWLRVVAGAPRSISPSYVTVPLAVTSTNVGAALLLPAALFFVVLGMAHYTPLTGTPWLVGVLSGLVVAGALQPLVTRLLRGRSSSLRDIRRARLFTFTALPFLATGWLALLNGALDRSPERVVEMTVQAATVDDDDSSKINVRAAGADGVSHSYTFQAIRPTGPARVRVRLRDGALGWEWQVGDAELLLGAALP